MESQQSEAANKLAREQKEAEAAMVAASGDEFQEPAIETQLPVPQYAIVFSGPPQPHKSLVEAYLLTIPFGFLGLQHFYLQRFGFALTYLFTLGLFGVGWIVDWFRMPYLVKRRNALNNNPIDEDQKDITDAYMLWFPFGLLGELSRN